MRTLIVTLLAVGLILAAGTAWAVTWDNFEDSVLGPIRDQAGGGGWANNNQAAWHGPQPTDTRNWFNVAAGGPSGQFVQAWGMDTQYMDRYFGEEFHEVEEFWIKYDFTIVGTITDDHNFYSGAPLGDSIHIEFRANKEIAHRGPGGARTVLGYWDGRAGHEHLNVNNEWKKLLYEVNVDAQRFNLWMSAPGQGGAKILVGENLAFRTECYSFNNVRFTRAKTEQWTPDERYLGFDNIWITHDCTPIPEPSSLLALAGGFVGMAGYALRRRR